MSYSNLSWGKDNPTDVNVIIEIPADSAPVKYEVDKDTNLLMVDRFNPSLMRYPVNYGYIPNTLSDDGDPIDVLMVTPTPLVHGSVIRARVIGLLNMTDDAGEDTKLIAVPHDKLSTIYRDVKSPSDLPAVLLEQIKHFFEHYKDLEEGKWVKLGSIEGVERAIIEIDASIKRNQES